MKRLYCFWTISAVLCARCYSQTPDGLKPRFEVVSIQAAAPRIFFHSSEAITGGPGSTDPGMFHCTCTLGALVTKAFELHRYQFPGESSLPAGTFDIQAKVPAGTTQEQFLQMLQSLLKDRFGLAWHFEEKEMQGYQLVVAKNGPKLKESAAPSEPSSSERYAGHGSSGGGDQHGGAPAHPGLINFGGNARYRGDHQTMAELALMISNQIAKPVDDQTGLNGKYDILLTWSGDAAPHNHQEGAGGHAGGGYGDHGEPAGASLSPTDRASGPTIFEAVQSQLGLRVVATKKSVARIFVVDHIEKTPTAN
ncbi:MAG TPA: TIGR03435 family protein [Bryobacteraceae bacterium]|nr:TIGR03435 family protein [Bryobacteraceae bacterium]